MGTGDVLGIVFASVILLIGIAVAIWFFGFRRPSNQTAIADAQTCSQDTDCVAPGDPDNVVAPPEGAWTGQVCVRGTCQNVSCNSNRDCSSKGLHGATCFGAGPNVLEAQAGCIPLSCRTTNDCNPNLTTDSQLADAPSICAPGLNICVPAKPPDGNGCFQGLSELSGGACGIPDTVACPAGSYKRNGRCLRCGLTNACSALDQNAVSSGFQLCEMGSDNTCTTGFTCTRSTGNGTISDLPNGQAIGSGLGICLPQNADCAFSYFNNTASASGSDPIGGMCPKNQPFCTSQGTCQSNPADAICALVPGVGVDGTTNDGYDLTGICNGRTVPSNSVANIAQFNTTGQSIGNDRCTVGPAGSDCSCDPSQSDSTTGRNPGCPRGSLCIETGEQIRGRPSGLCSVAGVTGTQIGRYYPGTCVVGTNNIATCVGTNPSPNTFIPALVNAGGPGDFCYRDEDCLLHGIKQPNNAFKALSCNTGNNVCVGVDQ
jgi:hypothetical protein